MFLILRKRERFFFIPPLGPARFKRTILDLGVCFIKLAQVLATRADFFSGDYLAELRTVHDEVDPMSPKAAQIMFERAFGEKSPFSDFDRTPIASASIGQVHRARLRDGREAAVKLRRLGVTRTVRVDLGILRSLIVLFQPLFRRNTQNTLKAIITEFSAMLLKETDMAIELSHLRKFQEYYGDCGVRFPEPYPEYCSSLALVMSFERGARVDDAEVLRRYEISFQEVMEKLVAFYAEQMLVRGFFHADPHPGNLLIREDGGLVLLDFGMVKRLSKSTRVAMIEMVKAAHDKDFELLIASYKKLGAIPASAPEEQLQELAERMFDIFGDENLDAANMQMLAFDVLESLKDFPFKLPQEVVYVMRASSLIEGLGTNYIKNFNGVKDILPVLRANLHRALGSEARLFPTIREELTGLPLTIRRLRSIVIDLAEGGLEVKLSRESIDLIEERARSILSPLIGGAVLAAAGFFVLQLDFGLRTEAAILLFLLGVLRIFTAIR